NPRTWMCQGLNSLPTRCSPTPRGTACSQPWRSSSPTNTAASSENTRRRLATASKVASRGGTKDTTPNAAVAPCRPGSSPSGAAPAPACPVSTAASAHARTPSAAAPATRRPPWVRHESQDVRGSSLGEVTGGEELATPRERPFEGGDGPEAPGGAAWFTPGRAVYDRCS